MGEDRAGSRSFCNRGFSSRSRLADLARPHSVSASVAATFIVAEGVSLVLIGGISCPKTTRFLPETQLQSTLGRSKYKRALNIETSLPSPLKLIRSFGPPPSFS